MTDTNPDFTGPDALTAFSDFEKAVGPRADIYLSLNTRKYGVTREGAFSLSVYPDGMTGGRDSFFAVSGDTMRGVLVEAGLKWDALSDTHMVRTISAMALEIIRLTDEHGEATDAALRTAKFDSDTVARYGARAAERATEMAGRGPFTLKTLGGDNGAPKDDEEDAE